MDQPETCDGVEIDPHGACDADCAVYAAFSLIASMKRMGSLPILPPFPGPVLAGALGASSSDVAFRRSPFAWLLAALGALLMLTSTIWAMVRSIV